MYCPQCGQQQVTGEVRFCSRCGFPLNAVSEILSSGGALPVPATSASSFDKLSPRQKGIRQGAMLMISVVLVVPVIIFIGVSMLNLPGELIPLAAIGCVMGGLLRILYASLFEDNTPPASQFPAASYLPPGGYAQMQPPPRNAALPPQRSVPAQSFMPPRRGDTSEMAQPPSVTDHTTRLLQSDPPDSDAR